MSAPASSPTMSPRSTSRGGRSGSTCDSGDVYLADALILATGAQARWLDLPSEQKFKGYGVSACATCDGFFYRGKEVVVIGGGNTAVEEALFLTNFAAKVTVVHRRDRFRAEKHPAGPPVQESEDRGDLGHACSTTCSASDNPLKVKRRARCAMSRPARSPSSRRRRVHRDRPYAGDRAGRRPARDEAVRLRQDRAHSTATSVPGVFAAGDVTDDVYRQAVTAAGLGCMAALEAERFLAAHGETARARRNDGHCRPCGTGRRHDDGLGQAQGLPCRRRGRQLHPCRRAARAVAVGGVAAGERARAGARRSRCSIAMRAG